MKPHAQIANIRRHLTYKTIMHGNTLQIVDRFFPSSKRCSACGHINPKLTLTDRTYICHGYSMVNDRDLKAAENLHRAGLVRIYACGHDGSVSAQRVHETSSMDEAGSQRGGMITIAHS